MARVSYFYGMDYPAVLAMPLKTFWSFNRNVDRLRAEADHRQLNLLSAAQHPEAVGRLADKLSQELGKPVVTVTPFDASKFKQLAEEFKRSKPPVG